MHDGLAPLLQVQLILSGLSLFLLLFPFSYLFYYPGGFLLTNWTVGYWYDYSLDLMAGGDSLACFLTPKNSST